MRLRCPHCERTLEVPDSAAGKQVRCPACSATTRAPEQAAEATSPVSETETSATEQAPATEQASATERKPLYSRPPASSPLSSPAANEPSSPNVPGERIACPQCAKMLLVTPALANQIVACPACHARMRMPSLADAARGVPAKLAFGVGQTWADEEQASSSAVQPAAASASHPYTTPVGAAASRPAAPSSGHSEPILYVLPAAFQLTVAVVIFSISLVSLVGTLIEMANFGMPNNADAAFGLFMAIASLLLTGIVIVGSIQMLRRRSLGLARAAAVLAILPCNVCCVALTPFGIWSTVMLFLPNAANDFR